ncbi:Mov34/MPN/PAD-1 family protein [Enteroscipio rubneri]|uniref:Mov34/MPN/PAD-1 family protein n=1 Tax=Enteroscipio rubneri TaxID=2070686 RepID=UPI00320878A5
MKSSSILTSFGGRLASNKRKTKVIFSARAYAALLSEVLDEVQTETGGVLLGYWDDGVWQVVESVDPGPSSRFEVAYFEYDQDYVNHLINKVSRIYEKQLDLIGLWHRHPGSFDRFSATDDETNLKYASLSKYGAVSALVNIDPHFRLTVYQVTAQPLRYEKISYEVLDRDSDQIQAPYANTANRALQIEKALSSSSASCETDGQIDQIHASSVRDALGAFLARRSMADMANVEVGTVETWMDEDFVLVLSALDDDVRELENRGIGTTLQPNGSGQLSLVAEDGYGDSLKLIEGFRPLDDGRILFAVEGQTYVYNPGLLSLACKEASL